MIIYPINQLINNKYSVTQALDLREEITKLEQVIPLICQLETVSISN